MMIMLLIFSFLLVGITIKFDNNTINKINEVFHESINIACEYALEINPNTFDVYFNQSILKSTIIDELNMNLMGIIEQYDVYVNYFYLDLTPCKYACKNVNIRLVSDINLICKFDKTYESNVINGKIK